MEMIYLYLFFWFFFWFGIFIELDGADERVYYAKRYKEVLELNRQIKEQMGKWKSHD